MPQDDNDKNFKSIISHFGIKSGVGKESGKPYRYLSISFTNGFEKLIFLDRAEWFAVDDATAKLEDTPQNNVM